MEHVFHTEGLNFPRNIYESKEKRKEGKKISRTVLFLGTENFRCRACVFSVGESVLRGRGKE